MLNVPRVLVVVALTAALLAGGCADGPDETETAARDREAPRSSRTPAPTASTTPAPAPSPAPTATPTKSSPRSSKGGGKIAPTPLPMARRAGSGIHLLTATTLPAAAPDASWTQRRTRQEGSRRTGVCQETPLVDIGALDAVIRGFSGPVDSGLHSRHLVARFADAKSAWRAHEVLRSWRSDCEERLARPRTDVSPMEDVEVDAGTGGHYRASYGTRRDTHVAGLGIVRAGEWLSVVEIRATEGDFPAAWTRRAVRRMAATFAG